MIVRHDIIVQEEHLLRVIKISERMVVHVEVIVKPRALKRKHVEMENGVKHEQVAVQI